MNSALCILWAVYAIIMYINWRNDWVMFGYRLI